MQAVYTAQDSKRGHRRQVRRVGGFGRTRRTRRWETQRLRTDCFQLVDQRHHRAVIPARANIRLKTAEISAIRVS